ncbi:FAD-dependent oxidoreductase [uncultured Pseudoalteromonas sp.]|uniref:L-aspartate oxidase n=1 Tax=uncultured Pseudoalteromonas sp. TaxID=114053 RepID=UPI0026066304|nr:FAD-dependent oxidoreductase [uncultured Pseudoalteromonas sp.]
MSKLTSLNAEVLVIGAGIAGCCAALEAAYAGKKVILISKIPPLHSHSVSARGGVNVAINEPDAFAHINDCLNAGRGVASKDCIEYMCESAPENLHWLEKLGVQFSKDESGHYKNKAFGGSNIPRACFSKDRTGLAIMVALIKQIKKNELITLLDQMMAVELIQETCQVIGAQVLHLRNTQLFKVFANSVVLSTGGGLNSYKYNTNAVSTTGDGLSLAFNAGAALRHMEFVQFHPLGLRNSGIQIPEPVLGAGGKIVSISNDNVMSRYYPEKKELAGRDKVSIAIAKELSNHPGSELYLDLTNIPEEKKFALKEASLIAATYLNADVTKDKISIIPSAHYLMGGVSCNINGQVLNCMGDIINGLFVAGEAACNGVHGANRIGGNSLLEVVVFGRLAGQNAAKLQKKANYQNASFKEFTFPFGDSKEKMGEILSTLKATMSQNAGVIRNENGLKEQLKILADLNRRYLDIKISDRTHFYNQQIKQYVELKNMLLISEAICRAALCRPESRGAHYRDDFPSEGNFFEMATLTYKHELGGMACELIRNS